MYMKPSTNNGQLYVQSLSNTRLSRVLCQENKNLDNEVDVAGNKTHYSNRFIIQLKLHRKYEGSCGADKIKNACS